MNFHIITIFPGIFGSYLNESIIKRAQEQEKIKIHIHNLRDWTDDKHRTVDDTPYGGGAGMVLKVEPVYKALQAIKKFSPSRDKSPFGGGVFELARNRGRLGEPDTRTRTFLFSAKGKQWNQQLARKYAKYDNIVMVCGRYEGVDERVRKFVDEEISIGPYVLTGGELPAMVVIDSITRLLPGVLGNKESLLEESHNPTNLKSQISNLKSLEYPQFTKPEIFEADGKKYRVPKILLSGNHEEIAKWREKKIKLIDN